MVAHGPAKTTSTIRVLYGLDVMVSSDLRKLLSQTNNVQRAMYVVTFMLSLVLVADLTRYESLPSQIRSHGLPEFDPDLPDDLEMTSTTGYQASASRLDPKRAGSYRRYSGRERGATSM